MIAIIFESNQQTEFEALSTRVNEHLGVVIPRYSATTYCLWAEALTNVVTEQRAFEIKQHIQAQIEGALTPEEIASIVDIPLTDKNWFPVYAST
jgi:hypothetical protein